MGNLYVRIANILLLCSVASLAAAAGRPAVYTIGNLEGISTGTEGILAVESDTVVFRTGKANMVIPYANIVETELGPEAEPADSAPLYKIWRLHKRLSPERAIHRALTIEFADKAGMPQTVTLDMEAAAAVETLKQIEIRQGKRHRTRNGDSWWGDNVWKTQRNGNTVGPDALGNTPAK